MSDKPVIRTLREKLVFENAYLRVYDNEVEFPSGATGQYVRTRWTAPHGVAALPVWRGNLLLLQNFRYSEDAHSVECCQGFGTDGGTPEGDMQRELHEEVGQEAARLIPLGHVGHDYRTHLYLARMADDFAYHAGGHEAGEAFGAPIVVPLRRGMAPSSLIAEHGIFDALTQILLLRLELMLTDEGLDLV